MIAAVIPAYNEAEHIEEVVINTKKYVDKVVVVNDGSTDGTSRIAYNAGAEVVAPDKKIGGAGGATAFGIRYVTADMNKNDVVITLDGDGQHDPNDIPSLINQMDNGAEFVIGKRPMDDMPLYRMFGNQIINYTCNIFSNVKVADTQSGFRAFRVYLLRNLPIETTNFGFCSEMVIKARAKNYEIREVPIKCVYHREFGANSTLNPFKHALQVELANLKWRLKYEVLKR